MINGTWSKTSHVAGTVKPVHTGMLRDQVLFRFGQVPFWRGFFAFGEEQTTITCTIDMRVIIQDVLSVGG